VSTIRTRLNRQELFVANAYPGRSSPLEKYELDFFAILIQMARMRESMSPSQAVSPINSLILDTHAQRNSNFNQMHEHVYEEMVDACIVEKMEIPVWQNKKGDTCMEDEAFDYKVTHDWVYPDMGFVVDEVGGDTSQKGDR